MPAKKNIAEEYVRIVNENLFLKEFTFTQNELKPFEEDEIELADNIVWLDEFLFLIQIKWRNPEDSTNNDSEEKWFKNKVIGKAKKQIKNTINYFKEIPNLEIANNAGFKVNLSEAPIQSAKKIIIYFPDQNLNEKQRLIKFYVSKDVGLIHIFQFQDYRWICQYLITICEINRYLKFREDMKYGFGEAIENIPELLILGKFLSGDEITQIDFSYLKFIDRFEEEINEFDFLPYLKDFGKKIINQENSSDYISVIKEIAKLTRFELKEFKLRFHLSIEKSKLTEYTVPFRISFPRIDCGFLFIPIDLTNSRFRDKWYDVLKNLTLANKYDQKLKKGIGVIIFRYPETQDYIEIYWIKAESDWEYDEEMDKELKMNFPFREVNEKIIGKYKFKN